MMTDFKYVPRMLAVRAIFYNPKLILADEPTGDPHSSQGEEIMELFCKLDQQGMTIMQVTHSEKNASYANASFNCATAGLLSKNNDH